MDMRWYELREIIRSYMDPLLVPTQDAIRLTRELEAEAYERLREEVRKHGT